MLANPLRLYLGACIYLLYTALMIYLPCYPARDCGLGVKVRNIPNPSQSYTANHTKVRASHDSDYARVPSSSLGDRNFLFCIRCICLEGLSVDF